MSLHFICIIWIQFCEVLQKSWSDWTKLKKKKNQKRPNNFCFALEVTKVFHTYFLIAPRLTQSSRSYLYPSPFYILRNWGSERSSVLPKVTINKWWRSKGIWGLSLMGKTTYGDHTYSFLSAGILQKRMEASTHVCPYLSPWEMHLIPHFHIQPPSLPHCPPHSNLMRCVGLSYHPR